MPITILFCVHCSRFKKNNQNQTRKQNNNKKTQPNKTFVLLKWSKKLCTVEVKLVKESYGENAVQLKKKPRKCNIKHYIIHLSINVIFVQT